MKISIEELKELAKNLYFDMSEEEYKTLQEEFEVIINQMELIDEIEDIDNLEPMVFPYLVQGHPLREDTPKDVLDSKDVLKNAADTHMGMIKVNKVVG